MSLRIVSELFKHEPVHLKSLRKICWWWEQIFQSGANYTTCFFQIYLSGVNFKNIFKRIYTVLVHKDKMFLPEVQR